MNTQYLPSFIKDLKALKSTPYYESIKIFAFEEIRQISNFTEITNIRKLQGYDNADRIRVGDYRIGIIFDGETVIFERVLHRKEIYRYFPKYRSLLSLRRASCYNGAALPSSRQSRPTECLGNPTPVCSSRETRPRNWLRNALASLRLCGSFLFNPSKHKPVTQTSKTGAAFIAGGTLAGAGISSTVGGMGLAGGFGAVGIGATPVTAAGAVAGAAVYGTFKAITEGDAAALGAMGIGAFGGAGFSSVFGGVGIVAPKIGLAFGVGTIPMAGVGAVVGLAAYGVVKLLDESGVRETPKQVFERMEEKVLYSAAVMELDLSAEDINQKFAALEVEDELKALKAKLKEQFFTPTPKIEPEIVTLTTQPAETWKCVQTLKGHTAAVNTIAIHADGNTFISGSDDRQVHLWNLNTGKWLYTFSGQAEAVLAVAISPDGKQIISGSCDRKITTWQLDTKKFNRTFFYLNSPYSHNGFVNAIAYSPDGRIIASASTDKTIRIWGGYTGTVKCTLNGHSQAVLAVAISPDCKTLVSSSADKSIRIWNLQNYQQRCILTQHSAAVNTVVISPDSQTLISGSTDTTIKLWHLHTGELLYNLTGHSTAILCVAISPDGKTLASSSRDGIIKLWNLQTGELLQTLAGCSPVAFHPDGKTLLSGGNGASIKIWRQVLGFDEFTPNPILSGEWWEVLGVNQTAHPQDVKLAYRRLARLYHPDVNDCAIAKVSMQAINQAYQKFQQQLKADTNRIIETNINLSIG